MADIIYNRFHYNVGAKLIDLNNDDIKATLLADTYTPDKDHNQWADISTHEVSGLGYVAGGQSLANQVYTEDDVNDLGKFDADDITWANATITAHYLALYDNTMAGKDLIMCFDFGGNKSRTAEDFVVEFNANGVYKSEQGA